MECGVIELPVGGGKAGGAIYTGRYRLYCPACQRHLCCCAVIRARTKACGKFGFTDCLKTSIFGSDCKMVVMCQAVQVCNVSGGGRSAEPEIALSENVHVRCI